MMFPLPVKAVGREIEVDSMDKVTDVTNLTTSKFHIRSAAKDFGDKSVDVKNEHLQSPRPQLTTSTVYNNVPGDEEVNNKTTNSEGPMIRTDHPMHVRNRTSFEAFTKHPDSLKSRCPRRLRHREGLTNYSVTNFALDPEGNPSRVARKQFTLAFHPETSCTSRLPVTQYDVALHDTVVVEFRMRNDSDFVTKKCSLLLVAPSNASVSVVLLEMSCAVRGLVTVTESLNRTDTLTSWKSCTRHVNPGVDWSSKRNTALLRVEVREGGLFTAKMNVMGVRRQKIGQIQTRYLAPALGYIQNARIQLNCCNVWRLIPVKTNTWTQLTAPENYVVMVSVAFVGLGSQPSAKACRHRVEVYEGSMNTTVWRLCSRHQGPTQPHVSCHQVLHVHYVTERNYDEIYQGIGFRLIFTFHDESSTPSRLSDGKWNCSTSTWLSFHRHITCDLVSHCAAGQDEADCPVYKSCGHRGLVWHGKCYSLIKLSPGTTWHHGNVVCSRLGPGGRLAPKSAAVDTVVKARLRFDLTIKGGHAMLIGLTTSNVDSHL